MRTKEERTQNVEKKRRFSRHVAPRKTGRMPLKTLLGTPLFSTHATTFRKEHGELQAADLPLRQR
jgi:hypothetical protein